jgi:SAM-dependent methyltransferase
VSGFKRADAISETEDLSSFFNWCRHHYLPLFRKLPRDAAILELGCGPGDLLQFLHDSGFSRAEGIDLSAEQVEIATGRGLNARVADVFECLETASQRYRVILAVDFVEHFSKDELMRLVPAIRSALEPGGQLIVQTPNGQGLFPHQIIYGDLTHMTIFTPDSLKQLFSLWEFDDFEFYDAGPAPGGWKGMIRTTAWSLIKFVANLVRRAETGKTQVVWSESLICRCRRV